MKHDSGSYAVFTEQGSLASQRTAAKVMDVNARPPDCAGQAADAVSAHTQVWRMLQNCSQFQCQNVLIFWIRLPRPKWPKSSSNIEDPVVPLQRNLYGHDLESAVSYNKNFSPKLYDQNFEDSDLGPAFR